jgi:hypothetical protein
VIQDPTLKTGSGNDFRFWMHQFPLPRTR